MSSRHRQAAGAGFRVYTVLIGVSAAVVLGVLVFGWMQDRSSVAAAGTVAVRPQPVSQEGRLVAVSPTSVPALGAAGVGRTYEGTAGTTSVTPNGGGVGATQLPFAVNDEVSIVGEVRGGTAVATAVASRAVSVGAGPPMDFVAP